MKLTTSTLAQHIPETTLTHTNNAFSLVCQYPTTKDTGVV